MNSMAWAALSNIIPHTLFQLCMNRVLWNRLLFVTLIIICETEIREINTSLAIQCMQACTRGCYKTINTNFEWITLLSCLVSASGAVKEG